MTETARTQPYTVGPDEKVGQVMIYTANALYWGEVVIKSMIRISTWLRTNTAPDRVPLYNAKAMYTGLQTPPRPATFSELHIATSQILSFHLIPPAKDPPDYDPTEPNRRMAPVSMMVGNFRVDGHLRLATTVSVAKFLEITRETYSAIYDAQISNPVMPSFGTVSVPYTLVRQETTIFGLP